MNEEWMGERKKERIQVIDNNHCQRAAPLTTAMKKGKLRLIREPVIFHSSLLFIPVCLLACQLLLIRVEFYQPFVNLNPHRLSLALSLALSFSLLLLLSTFITDNG